MDPGQGLAAATVIGAVIAVPYGVAIDGRRLFTPAALGLGAIIALLADVLAYSLQATALGRMPGRLFSILTSTATHGFRAVVRPCRSRRRSVGCGRAGP
jgi:threonine/homoserine efflux transporter RhtA